MGKITKRAILNEVTRFYLESDDFNGIPMSQILSFLAADKSDIIRFLSNLINEDKISLVFGDIHPNPHIRAFPDEPKDAQIRKLKNPALDRACIYPSANHLEKVVDRSKYEGKPFTLSMALGSPQLIFKAFDLSVLEYYRNDPRYYYVTDDIQGWICIHDDYFNKGLVPESDEILLRTFGFCYDDKINRAVAVFLRYIGELSAEHQQIWRLKMLGDEYQIHPDYFVTTIIGDWNERISIFEAFREELRTINALSCAIGRPFLFKDDFMQNKPREFGFLIRPTLKEYNSFVLLLDKMLSDNINKSFFMKDIPDEFEEIRKDGRLAVKQKGTLSMLDEWLRSNLTLADSTPVEEMMSVFREVRKKRQKPAHAVDDNLFDQQYFLEQRNLMIRVYKAISFLRSVFMSHPSINSVKINRFLAEGKIWTF